MIEYPTSLEDPRLDVYARLTELQLRNRLEPEKGIFIAESDKVIDRALTAGYQPLSLLVPEHRFKRMAGLVERMGGNKSAEEGGLTVFVMPAEEVEKLAGYELTRGVLCAMRRKPLPTVEEVVAHRHPGRHHQPYQRGGCVSQCCRIGHRCGAVHARLLRSAVS